MSKIRNPAFVATVVLGVLILLFLAGIFVGLRRMFGEDTVRISSNSVLVLEVRGIIQDSKRIVSDLRKYAKDKDVQAVVVRIDSPGGVVGPAQEIYQEIRNLRTKEHKVVVASLGSVAASGGYYIAAACDKIVTNPGTITGSIGVIMEFADISKLYDWARINRYVIKTGPYKDTGAEFRPMNADEKAVMQQVIDNVFGQFKKAVSEGRKLPLAKVDSLADGRIYSGQQAVKLGLADKEGSLTDAVAWAAELAGIKGEPKPFYAPKARKNVMDILFGGTEDEEEMNFEGKVRKFMNLQFIGQPLYLMPGTLQW